MSEESSQNRISFEECGKKDSVKPSRWVWGKGTQQATWPQAIMIYVACIVPNIVAISCLSDIGVGLQVYNFVAPQTMNLAGDAAVFTATLSICVLYVSDWFYYKSRTIQVVTGLMPCFLIMAGACLKGRKYPFAPLLCTLFVIPALLGLLRSTVCAPTKRRDFYTAVGIVTGCCTILLSVSWLVWMLTDGHQWNRATKDDLVSRSAELYKVVYADGELDYLNDCHPLFRNISNYTTMEKPKVTTACAKAVSVWFLVWLSPMVAAIVNFVLCIFSFAHGVRLDSSDQPDVIRALKQFLACLVFLFGCMYASTSFTSLAMGSTIMAFMAAGLSVLVVWTFVEIGSDALLHMATASPFAGTLAMCWKSDVMRAVAVGAVNVMIPIFFCLNMLTQKVRVWRGTNGDHRGKYTENVGWLVQEMGTWRWTAILVWVALLAELHFMLKVGVTKVTYLFLSWLSKILAEWSFGTVVVLVFVIGYCMFLLPPVPGVPVYVFSGIVLALQGQKNLGDSLDPMDLGDNGTLGDDGGSMATSSNEMGFLYGCIVAVFVGFICKLAACCGQYMIGYYLGKSVKVQQMIHVDAVFTRGIERILKRKGLDVAKVAVLIGGPDWPVSVSCGILGVNVPQMLLGTMPVFFLLTPCVLAGAFISRAGGVDEDSIYPMLGNISLLGMMVGQVSAGLVAFFSVMKVVQEDREELEKPRPEHKEVEELTRREAYAKSKYDEISRWSKMRQIDKVVLLACVVFHILAGAIFVMLASACFKPFEVNNDIKAPSEEGGLDGDWTSIVLPTGMVALALFFIAVVLHVVHIVMMKRRWKRILIAEPEALGGVDGAAVPAAKSEEEDAAEAKPSVDVQV